MSRTRSLWIGLALAVCAGGPIRAGDDPPKQEKKQTQEERYQAILKEFNDGMTSFQTDYQKAKTDAERQKAFEKYPQPSAYFDRLLKLAEEDPKSKVAFDALMWIGTNARQGQNDASKKAFDLLARNHLDNERIGDVAAALRYQMNATSEQFLRDILEKSASKKAKGLACLTLAQYLSSAAQQVAQLNDSKDKARVEMMKNFLGKDYAKALADKGPEGLSKEAEGLFERAKDEFADVKTYRGTVGEAAGRELFELKNLVIGKPAPEISGEDIDGKALKLSDFKGKVVVLDFFGDW